LENTTCLRRDSRDSAGEYLPDIRNHGHGYGYYGILWSYIWVKIWPCTRHAEFTWFLRIWDGKKQCFSCCAPKPLVSLLNMTNLGWFLHPPHFRNNASDILAKDIFGQEHVDINMSFAKNMEDIWEFSQNHRESTNMDIYYI
jgi:hypothetical protein